MKSRSEFIENLVYASVWPMIAVFLLWLVFWVEVRLGFNFTEFGIYPRSFSGLRGILFGPFIHGSVKHLYNNTFPVFFLMLMLMHFYRPVALKVLFLGVAISGFFTWLFGREAYHIGASGLIYVLASFIFFKGILSKNYRLVALSLVTVFLYGSLLWYVLPIEEKISWEGHASGFIAGLFLSFLFKKDMPGPVRYVWESEDYKVESDPFMKHFDEKGNFIPSSEMPSNNDERDNNPE